MKLTRFGQELVLLLRERGEMTRGVLISEADETQLSVIAIGMKISHAALGLIEGA